MPEGPHEEYLLYVRVPDPEDQSRDATIRFLERIATLLSDDDEGIYVEPAATYDEKHKKRRGKHGTDLGINDDAQDRFDSAVGSDQNSLGPLYFCHNKF
jgi:hypothetical protein